MAEGRSESASVFQGQNRAIRITIITNKGYNGLKGLFSLFVCILLIKCELIIVSCGALEQVTKEGHTVFQKPLMPGYLPC